ncbi:MAG TPA: hypothetical protein VHB99_11640 [Pirellulales bacterium]|nr:hypothetical protein [Pirellulales bacterium]
MTTRSRNNRKKAESSRAESRSRPIPPWQWFLLAAAAPIALCAARLNQDLWHDEIYTLVTFAAAGPAKIVTDYSAPNNHVLYSLVLWLVQQFSTTNFALRLPSVAFSIGTLAMTFRAAWRLGDQTMAVLATLLLGLNQMFLIHAVQVRGYPLAMFLFAWLINLAIPEQGSLRFSRLAGIALVGAAFLYVTPSDLLFFAPLAAAALVWQAATAKRAAIDETPVERTTTRRMLAAVCAAWGAAFALAALCYAPIAGQVFEHRGAGTQFTPDAILFAAETFLKPATHDFVYFGPVFLLGPLAWCVRRFRGREVGSPAALVLSLGTILAAFLLTAALGVSPFPRNFTPLLPLVAMGQTWTVRELLRAIPWKGERATNAASLVAVLVVVAVLAPQLAAYPTRLDAYCRQHPGAHDGYFNYYAAGYRPAAIVARVKELTADGRPYRICYAEEDHWNLAFYFKQAGVPLARRASDRSDSAARVFVISPHAADWADIATRCELPEAELRQLPIIEDFGYYVLKG